MPESVELLEELSFRTLPSLDEERYDGWVLRWSDGGSRRANSTNVIDLSALPIAAKIRHCEEWFAARGATAIFRLTPLADETLDSALDTLGYTRSSPTAVMTVPLATYSPDPTVSITDQPSAAWLRSIPGMAAADSHRMDRLAHQLTSSGGRHRFASITVAGGIVAIGMSLDLGGYTTVYNMNTASQSRRQGHARTILDVLLAGGVAAGSERAVLQVTEDNDAALALYRTAGFATAYSYYYREQLR